YWASFPGEGRMWMVDKRFQVKLGGNIYINTPRLIEVRHAVYCRCEAVECLLGRRYSILFQTAPRLEQPVSLSKKTAAPRRRIASASNPVRRVRLHPAREPQWPEERGPKLADHIGFGRSRWP